MTNLEVLNVEGQFTNRHSVAFQLSDKSVAGRLNQFTKSQLQAGATNGAFSISVTVTGDTTASAVIQDSGKVTYIDGNASTDGSSVSISNGSKTVKLAGGANDITISVDDTLVATMTPASATVELAQGLNVSVNVTAEPTFASADNVTAITFNGVTWNADGSDGALKFGATTEMASGTSAPISVTNGSETFPTSGTVEIPVGGFGTHTLNASSPYVAATELFNISVFKIQITWDDTK